MNHRNNFNRAFSFDELQKSSQRQKIYLSKFLLLKYLMVGPIYFSQVLPKIFDNSIWFNLC
jgi:hypothetical protein